MHLTAPDRDMLLVVMAGQLARQRKSRGHKLNQQEATAFISAAILDMARAGKPIEEIQAAGQALLTRDDVQDGVADAIQAVEIEAVFPDGLRPVVVRAPIA